MKTFKQSENEIIDMFCTGLQTIRIYDDDTAAAEALWGHLRDDTRWESESFPGKPPLIGRVVSIHRDEDSVMFMVKYDRSDNTEA